MRRASSSQDAAGTPSPLTEAGDRLHPVIRVAILDDHPAVLAGLQRLVERSDDLLLVAAAATSDALWRQLDETRADVVVLDYDLTRGDGLSLCQRLKERVRPPAVAIYSAYAG